MKNKNEAGYTLVLVLLTITLIFIFSLTIISNVLNSAKQNNTIEKQIQFKQASQMGVTYMEAAIGQANKQANNSVVDWLKKPGQNPPNPIPTDGKITEQYIIAFDGALKKSILIIRPIL